RRPPCLVMAVPVVGGFRIEKFGIRSRPRSRVNGSSQKLWKSLWKTWSAKRLAPHQIKAFERFAPRRCVPPAQTRHYNLACTSSLQILFLPPPPTRFVPPDIPLTPVRDESPTRSPAISRTRTR